jgi:hypothetical protein
VEAVGAALQPRHDKLSDFWNERHVLNPFFKATATKRIKMRHMRIQT